MKLSILVPSVHTRYMNGTNMRIQSQLFGEWRELPEDQRAEIEILILTDTKSRTIGAKRNDMLDMAQGEYVAFVDDDDRVTPDYLQTLLRATDSRVDVITFQVEVSLNGDPTAKPCYYSLDYLSDYNGADAYYRLPNHLMCVKRDLARKARFPETQRGEDAEYAKRLRPLLRTEHPIHRVLYYYDFNSQTTETQGRQ